MVVCQAMRFQNFIQLLNTLLLLFGQFALVLPIVLKHIAGECPQAGMFLRGNPKLAQILHTNHDFDFILLFSHPLTVR